MNIIGKIAAAALIMAQTAPAFAKSEPAPALPKVPRDAATTCYWSTVVSMGSGKDQVETISEGVWYLLDYLRAEKVPGDALEQMQKLSSQGLDRVIALDDPAAVAAICRQRNPRNSAAAVDLPADPFERDTLCMAATSLIVGFATSQKDKSGGSALLDPATALLERIAERLDDKTMAAHGHVGDAAVEKLISQALGQATSRGGIMGIYNACAAQVRA